MTDGELRIDVGGPSGLRGRAKGSVKLLASPECGCVERIFFGEGRGSRFLKEKVFFSEDAG